MKRRLAIAALAAFLSPPAQAAVSCADWHGERAACLQHPPWHADFVSPPAALAGAALAVQWQQPQPDAAPSAPKDRWEGYNRRIFAFNDWADRKILRPLAKSYREHMPKPAATGLRNIGRNLREPMHVIYTLLRGDIAGSASALGRFLLNSTVGIVGLFDVAGAAGLKYKSATISETLEAWGVPSGPYFLLPLLPPGTFRDQLGRAPDAALNLRNHIDDAARYGLLTTDTLDARGELLAADAFVVGDRYTAIRDLYFSNRAREAAAEAKAESGDGEAEEAPSVFDDDF